MPLLSRTAVRTTPYALSVLAVFSINSSYAIACTHQQRAHCDANRAACVRLHGPNHPACFHSHANCIGGADTTVPAGAVNIMNDG
jgi:hypothetical protein